MNFIRVKFTVKNICIHSIWYNYIESINYIILTVFYIILRNQLYNLMLEHTGIIKLYF